jgi:hypothetical protein
LTSATEASPPETAVADSFLSATSFCFANLSEPLLNCNLFAVPES